jgi:hypothetical protein
VRWAIPIVRANSYITTHQHSVSTFKLQCTTVSAELPRQSKQLAAVSCPCMYCSRTG